MLLINCPSSRQVASERLVWGGPPQRLVVEVHVWSQLGSIRTVLAYSVNTSINSVPKGQSYCDHQSWVLMHFPMILLVLWSLLWLMIDRDVATTIPYLHWHRILAGRRETAVLWCCPRGIRKNLLRWWEQNLYLYLRMLKHSRNTIASLVTDEDCGIACGLSGDGGGLSFLSHVKLGGIPNKLDT